MPSTQSIIQIAKVSQYLAIKAIEVNGLYGGSVDRHLPRKLYLIRKNVEWLYDLAPADTSLIATGNYLYSLCAPFSIAAQAILNVSTGGSIAPIVSGTSGIDWIRILSGDFANATDYELASLSGKVFRLQANWLGSRYLEPETEWEYLLGGGFRILLSGFDATVNDYEIYLDIQGQTNALSNTVSWENVTGKPNSLAEYNLTANTQIDYNGDTVSVLTVAIYPNGFNYTWGSMFYFTDNNPEQPLANGVNTVQLYVFQNVSGRYICIGQSLNAAI